MKEFSNRLKFVEEKPTGLISIKNALKKDNLEAKNWYFPPGG